MLTKVYRGDTWRIQVPTTNVPDGSTVYVTVKKSKADSTPLVSGSAVVLGNTTEIIISYTNTQNIDAPGVYYVDAQVTISGEVFTLDVEMLPVHRDVRSTVP